MQNLKSYRENNPGKGYWDWKAEAFAEGGQTGDPEKERFYQATGRSSSGRPLEEGLKPVFSLEDAANMTPIGDAISAKDAYDAVKNRDWLGAGLAAATLIPFVAMTVKSYRKKYKGITPKREIPTVNKAAEQDAINKAIEINPKDSKFWFYKGENLLDMNRFQEAVESINTGLELDPRDYDAWCKLVYSYYGMGDYENALDTANYILKLEPDDSVMLEFKSIILSDIEKSGEQSYDVLLKGKTYRGSTLDDFK